MLQGIRDGIEAHGELSAPVTSISPQITDQSGRISQEVALSQNPSFADIHTRLEMLFDRFQLVGGGSDFGNLSRRQSL